VVSLKEHAVSPESAEHAIDRRGAASVGSGELSVGHGADGVVEDLRQQ